MFLRFLAISQYYCSPPSLFPKITTCGNTSQDHSTLSRDQPQCGRMDSAKNCHKICSKSLLLSLLYSSIERKSLQNITTKNKKTQSLYLAFKARITKIEPFKKNYRYNTDIHSFNISHIQQNIQYSMDTVIPYKPLHQKQEDNIS